MPPTPATATQESRDAARFPAYARLREALRQEIEDGYFDDGRRMPTDLELTRRFGISRHTARRALSELVTDGLVIRVPGRGTFVTGAHKSRYVRMLGKLSDVMALRTDTHLRVVDGPRPVRDPYAEERLQVERGELVAITVLRHRDGIPVGSAEIYLPAHIAQLLNGLSDHADRTTTIVELVGQALDQEVIDADQEVTAVAADPLLARLLEVPEGSALLQIERLYFASSGTAVELSIGHYRPDQYSYRLALRGSA